MSETETIEIEGIAPEIFYELVQAQVQLFLLMATYQPSTEVMVHVRDKAYQQLPSMDKSGFTKRVDLLTHLVTNQNPEHNL